MHFANLGLAEIVIVLAVVAGLAVTVRRFGGGARRAPATAEPAGLVYCRDCGRQISARAASCPHCGSPHAPAVAPSTKSRGVAVFLALFLGGIGAHKFYLDRPGMGVLYLVFFWTCIPSLVGFIEALVYLSMSNERFAAVAAAR
jgi:TM2 domain-containing membrane protein YozV